MFKETLSERKALCEEATNTAKENAVTSGSWGFYAREGGNEREFQILLKENPHSMIAKKLVKQVASWQSR